MSTIRTLIEQIHTRYGGRIYAAVSGTNVPAALVAAFIVNESGRDKKGNIVDTAKRFEPGVYKRLVSIRDNGYYVVKNKATGKSVRRNNYSGVFQRDVSSATDDALKALATSWGTLQIMGWHCIHNLMDSDGTPVTIAELRDPERHIQYAVQLLRRVASSYIAGKKWAQVFKIWNTGSPTGTTYHASYVPNGLQAMKIWNELFGSETASRIVKFSIDTIVGATPAELRQFEQPAALEAGEDIGESDNDLGLESPESDSGISEVPPEEIPPATDRAPGQNGGVPTPPQTPNDPPKPIPGGEAAAVPQQVTEETYWDKAKRVPGKVYALITTGTIITYQQAMEWLGILNENRELVMIVVIALAAIGLYLMHNSNKVKVEAMRQKHEYELEKMKIAANPNLQTVA